MGIIFYNTMIVNYFTEAVGYAAGVASATMLIPQIYTTCKLKDTESISVGTLILNLLCSTLWLIYGILQNLWPIIISNIPGVIFSIILIGLKLYFCKPKVVMECKKEKLSEIKSIA